MSDDDARPDEARTDDVEELLGAYALDAVSEEERRLVEEYLLVNPRARAEVEEHREVASLLAWSGAAAPEGLWDRIAATLEETAPPPSGELANVLAMRPSRRARWRNGAATAAVAAAAAVAAVVVVDVTRRDDGDDTLAAAVERAREDRDSRIAKLLSADGREVAQAIIDQDGRGYLLGSDLPALPPNRTWQLWGVIDDRPISLGVLGNEPELEVFTVEADVDGLIITNEVAGGVVSNGNPDGAVRGFVN